VIRPPLAVHVVFEYGTDGQPFGSAHIRLLRPLSHPRLAERVRATFGEGYRGEPVDVVIVDRLWRPDVSADKVERLVALARRTGAKVIHAVDDNFLDLLAERPEWGTPARRGALEALLALADGLLVTTTPLAERYRAANPNIAVVPNALDERLLAVGRPSRELRRLRSAVARRLPGSSEPVVIGYMGTYTHDDDLALIAPALHAIHARHGDRVRFQVLGVVARGETWSTLAGLPVEAVHPTPAQAVYPDFLPWLCNTFAWDIALAPLRRTPFTDGKSDIKHLDYAALGAAGIYSRHPAYAATVRDGETGMLADDDPASWTAALDRLVTDGALRGRIARGARRYLASERTLEHTAERWPDALAALVDRADDHPSGGRPSGERDDPHARAEAFRSPGRAAPGA
jgi:processive 1,2-diacylglycerol beta-glucosyltransferase